MRGRRFYGGGSGFLLCFAAERKRCATGSLLQLPPPSHTLLWEKVAVRLDFFTVRHYALRCVPPEAQCHAPGSSRQFSLTTYTFLRGGGYAWPEVLRRRVWISALLCGRKETLRARKPVPIAAPISHAFAGKGYCATGFFALFGIVHCVAFRQKRNAVRPEVRGSSLSQLTHFRGEEVMRGRRFYGGGSGFQLCFAAERKRCAPESLLQLPPPSHTLLREKDTVNITEIAP